MLAYEMKSNYTIPALGLGSAGLDTSESIKHAIHIGYHHIDTAAYYENELAVSQAIHESDIPRENIFVTTKIWKDHFINGTAWDSFEQSYKDLNLPYIDLLLIHWPSAGNVEEAWRILQDIQQTGKVRSIGVSNHRIKDLEVIRTLSGEQPVVNQIELHPYLQQNEIVDYCQNHNIVIEAWSPFCAQKNNLLAEPILQQLGDKYKKSPAQIVLRWDIQRKIIPLPRSSNFLRQEQNIDVFDFVLTPDDMEQIKSLDCNGRIGDDPTVFGNFNI